MFCVYTNSNYLNIRAVYELLKIFKPNNIMIYITTNLKKPMEAMRWQTMGANTCTTIQAENIFLVLLCCFMIGAPNKEFLRVESFQPCRLLNSLYKHHIVTKTHKYIDIYEPKKSIRILLEIKERDNTHHDHINSTSKTELSLSCYQGI